MATVPASSKRRAVIRRYMGKMRYQPSTSLTPTHDRAIWQMVLAMVGCMFRILNGLCYKEIQLDDTSTYNDLV